MASQLASYHGRLAPSPTGYLHLGHARTFWIAAQRARTAGGTLQLRNDDLDRARCRPEFVAAMQEDLRWLGLAWEDPMISQHERVPRYRAAFETLRASGAVYPCWCSRRDVAAAVSAPHAGDEDDEPLYPGTCRPENLSRVRPKAIPPAPAIAAAVGWRFHVPDGRKISFRDHGCGEQSAVAGRDFGDFLVWRKDDTPSYQLATVVDDADFRITEIVRGADLIKSTFRQLLLFGALGAEPPQFFHCPLLLDERGERLAKRHDALALRSLRANGVTPEEIVRGFEQAIVTSAGAKR